MTYIIVNFISQFTWIWAEEQLTVQPCLLHFLVHTVVTGTSKSLKFHVMLDMSKLLQYLEF